MIGLRLVLLCPLLLASACFNPSMTIDARSALEQQLTREAVARAIDRLVVHEAVLQGEWFVEVASPWLHDTTWIRSMVSYRLASLGAKIRPNKAEDVSVVTAAVQYAGSDVDNFFIGVPLGDMYQTLAVYQSVTERGRARISLIFWDANGELIARSPPATADTYYKDLFILTFFGPFASTDLEDIDLVSRWGDASKEAEKSLKKVGKWIVPSDAKKPGDGETPDS